MSAAAVDVPSYGNYTFEEFLLEHGKTYEREEHFTRKLLFEATLEKVVAHNQEFQAGQHSWFMAMNHLSDWTPAEFKRLRAKKSGEAWGQSPPTTLKSEASGPNPTSVDWRKKNVVTPVKNQGGCGSCWAFASTETMESHYAIASGKLLVLAPQGYVDCVTNPHECGGKGGCEGATEEIAFNMSSVLGLPLETDLPYQGMDGKCQPYKAAVKNTGYVKVPSNDASAFETALATKGPLAITVAAEPWMSYGGGVFNGCTGAVGAELDHGVQAVGYTPEYWIVRNSWGPGWGEKGYIFISREKDDVTSVDTKPADGVACQPYPTSQTVKGECGIFSDSSYPTFDAVNEEIVV
jgi:cathepsin L